MYCHTAGVGEGRSLRRRLYECVKSFVRVLVDEWLSLQLSARASDWMRLQAKRV